MDSDWDQNVSQVVSPFSDSDIYNSSSSNSDLENEPPQKRPRKVVIYSTIQQFLSHETVKSYIQKQQMWCFKANCGRRKQRKL